MERPIDPGDSVYSVTAAFRQACSRADQAVAQCSLNDLAQGRGDGRTVRWIYLHSIQEMARHCGQADILRELTDGVTGE